MSRRKEFLSTYIRPDQHDALAVLTAEHGIPKSQIVRYALDVVLGGTGWVEPAAADRTPLPLAPGAPVAPVNVCVAPRRHPVALSADTGQPGAIHNSEDER